MSKSYVEMLYTMYKEISEEKVKMFSLQVEIMKKIMEIDGEVDIAPKSEKKDIISSFISEETENPRHDMPSFNLDMPKQEVEVEGQDTSEEKATRDNSIKITDRYGKVSSELINSAIIDILKASNNPMSLKEIHKELMRVSGENVAERNFRNNIFPRLFHANDDVIRVERGLYWIK